ncbi:MAG: hypothetical protein OEU80_00150 [Deltaproteobacteria bacterium]|nr:hypothetical protein [Deltaproteobacteria bacterium]MDH3800483.1 hypothetical protein [Deltaproteobacteria bacterium]MDH3850553.1 hypothetical protein [Deltaproteobacteria bacterium]MDH3896988.1 hypothetical protein [Deltaproteobacteria bacterium]MDH3926784.1 hypothetical protein [Deltaproteobacteria bacterium]
MAKSNQISRQGKRGESSRQQVGDDKYNLDRCFLPATCWEKALGAKR